MSGTRATLRNTGTAPQWGALDPTVPNPAAKNDLWVGGFSSDHSQICNFLFGDGRTDSLSNCIDMKVFQQLGNRADGKIIGTRPDGGVIRRKPSLAAQAWPTYHTPAMPVSPGTVDWVLACRTPMASNPRPPVGCVKCVNPPGDWRISRTLQLFPAACYTWGWPALVVVPAGTDAQCAIPTRSASEGNSPHSPRSRSGWHVTMNNAGFPS